MATLTETAYYTRKYIKIGAIGLVIFIILRILLGIFLNYLTAAFPQKLKPDNAYGRLSAIQFPQGASPSAQLKLTLRTVDGTVPEASEAAKVYFMPKGRPNLLSLSNAESLVAGLDFTTSPRQLSDTLYRWVDIKSPLRTIEMDIVNNHFSLVYFFQHELTLFTEKQLPTPQEAVSDALTVLKDLNSYTGDVDSFNPSLVYLKLVGNQLTPTTSRSQADAMQLDFFRYPYDGIRMVTDKPNQANIAFIFSGMPDPKRRILFARYQHWTALPNEFAVYKLKATQVAWEELLAGHAYYASLPENVNEIPITNVYLAYYDGSLPQLYLQPVFVFEGEPNFTAYVPAVEPPWTE